jgi:inactivated superfamily I helicase
MMGSGSESGWHKAAEEMLNRVVDGHAEWRDGQWIQLRTEMMSNQRNFAGRIARFVHEFMPVLHKKLELPGFDENSDQYVALARAQAETLATIQTNLEQHKNIAPDEMGSLIGEYKEELLTDLKEYAHKFLGDSEELNEAQWAKLESEFSRLFDYFASDGANATLTK